MTLEQAEKIVEAMEDNNYEAKVREEYSGRGMYGKTCVGIVASPSCGMEIGFFASQVGILTPEDLPDRTDNMGLDMIFY